jgi:hypothetical protein
MRSCAGALGRFSRQSLVATRAMDKLHMIVRLRFKSRIGAVWPSRLRRLSSRPARPGHARGGTIPLHLPFEANRGPQIFDVAGEVLLGRPLLGIVFGEMIHQVGQAVGHGV